MTGCGIPHTAAVALNDLLDHCAHVKPGQEIVILAHVDGLHGGDNLVDQATVAWVQAAVQLRGANPSVLWIDEKAVPHQWRLPPVVRAALSACDVLINHSFDIVWEEMVELKQLLIGSAKLLVRNLATTAPLLCSAWAQTPHELVGEIRYRASLAFQPGLPFLLTDPNGTRLEGTIATPYNPTHRAGANYYSQRREEAGPYRPWPEWVHPPVALAGTHGVFVFDRMLSWWSRYIGIPPFFAAPIRVMVEAGRIVKIEGGDEAGALRAFLASMAGRLGEGVYDFNCLHFGVHPQAAVGPHQCPSELYRRLVEHGHSSNIHIHIGAPKPTETYPYWMHCTGDVRNATFRVGDVLVHDGGHLTALDDPAVAAIAAKYPGRPGVGAEPSSY